MNATDNWSASPEDAIEQNLPAGPDEDQSVEVVNLADDVPEADALEQAAEVPLDEEDAPR
jgi:hypothetical protein